MKSKWIIAAIVFSLAHAAVYAEVQVGTDLTGHVSLPEGISGAATILVTYAQLKTNFESPVSIRSPILPKRTQTDRHGNFKIESLDARWLYLVMAWRRAANSRN